MVGWLGRAAKDEEGVRHRGPLAGEEEEGGVGWLAGEEEERRREGGEWQRGKPMGLASAGDDDGGGGDRKVLVGREGDKIH